MPPPSPTIGNCRLRTGSSRAVVGGAVEGAVAQSDPAEVGDRLLEIGHRGGALLELLRRRGVERIVLGLDGSALAGVPGEGGNALRDESAHAGLARGGQQRVGALRSQLAGLGRHLVHVAAELHLRQRGRLVHDRLGLRLEHGRAHRSPRRADRACTGFAPSVRSSSALAGELWLPITSWPASISWGTSRLPIAPLAPVTKTRILSSLSFFWSHPADLAGHVRTTNERYGRGHAFG